MLVSHGGELPPGTVEAGPNTPVDVRFPLRRFNGWVPIVLVADALGVTESVVTVVAKALGPHMELWEGAVVWIRGAC